MAASSKRLASPLPSKRRAVALAAVAASRRELSLVRECSAMGAANAFARSRTPGSVRSPRTWGQIDLVIRARVEVDPDTALAVAEDVELWTGD